jgi:hypothetical protein
MKLTSDPKPVRFRIMSGGEEHSSLDSLRHNFSIDDLKIIENQLLRWLKRQGKEGEQIAKRLEVMPNGLSNCSSLDDYFSIYQVFFFDIISSYSKYNDKMAKWPCFSKKGTLRDLFFWFKENGKYEKNLSRLENILWEFDEDFFLSIIEESLNKNTLNKEYLGKLEKTGSGHADYLLGRYYIEQVPDFIKGYKLLLSAKKKGYTKKVQKYIEGHRLARKYNQWRHIDIQYMKEYIEKCVNFKLSMAKSSNSDLIPKERDGHEWTKREEQLALFVLRCCRLINNRSIQQNDNYAYSLFCEKNTYRVEEPFLEQKFFILTIVNKNLNTNLYEDMLKESAEDYYPTKYLLDIDETHPILDKFLFRELGTSGKIRVFLNYIFEF